MKKILALCFLCLFGIGIVYTVLGTQNGLGQRDEMSYDSDVNMKSTLAEMQTVIKNMYSSSKYSNVKVSTSYQTAAVLCENLSQTRLVYQWNKAHSDKNVNGVCGVVANTMLLQKYMQLVTGKLPKTYSDVAVFNAQMSYAWGSGKIFNKDNRSGTSVDEDVKLLNYYLDTYESNKYTANADSTGLWSTCKSYLDDKIRPIILHLNGKNAQHQVLGTCGYIEQVTYKTTTLGITFSHTDNYKVMRICNGWNDSLDSGWNSTTNSYVFFDCVEDLIKLK